MQNQPPKDEPLTGFIVRRAEPRDHDAIRRLYEESRLAGQTRENDTGADIEGLEEAYFREDDTSCFWVADLDGEVVGMVGVQQIADQRAEIRRLRVSEAFRRRGIGSALMAKAMDFCAEHEFLKVILDVRVERTPAITMFEACGFQHANTRDVDGYRVLDFYLNLYREPRHP